MSSRFFMQKNSIIVKIINAVWLPFIIFFTFSISTFSQFGRTEIYGADTQCNFSDLLEWIDDISGRLFEECGYPPLAACIYKMLKLFKKNTIADCSTYVDNYIVLLTILITAIGLYSLFQKSFKEKGRLTNIWAFSLFFTTPILWSYHWLNLILYAFIFTLIFIIYYDSDKKYERVIALISLAIAANLKYYPGIFVLLLLNKKRIKDFFLEGFLMASMFITPFIIEQITIPDKVCGNLLDQIASIIKFTFGWHSDSGGGWTAITMSFSDTMNKLLVHIHFIDEASYGITIKLLFVVYIIASIILFYLAKRKDQKLFFLGLMCIFVPNWSPYYSMVFMMIPFLAVLNIERKNCIIVLECILYAAMFLPIYGWGPIWLMSYNCWHIILLYMVISIEIVINRFYIKNKEFVD